MRFALGMILFEEIGQHIGMRSHEENFAFLSAIHADTVTELETFSESTSSPKYHIQKLGPNLRSISECEDLFFSGGF